MTPFGPPSRYIEGHEFTEIAFGLRMFVISAPHRTNAAAANDLLDGTKRGLLAVEIERDVEHVRLRTERHRAPALEPGGARTLVDFDAQFGDLALTVRDFASLRIHLHDVLIADVGRVNKSASGSIELPQNSQLAHLEERLPSADVDQEVLEHLVHVLRLAGKVLVVPLHLACVGIERESRVRVERVSVGAAGDSGPRLGLRRGPINEVRFRIVAARDPRVAARAERQRQVAPRVAAGLTGTSNCRRAPHYPFGG